MPSRYHRVGRCCRTQLDEDEEKESFAKDGGNDRIPSKNIMLMAPDVSE